jgi:hypothetical protein
MVEPLRHRQTKGAATDMFYLTPPRHISTLPKPVLMTLKRDFRNALVLLRHRFARERRAVEAPQHGQRGKHLMIAAMSLLRMVAIEFGMCRSGRKGGSSGSVTVGYGKLREQRGGMRS